MVKCREPLIKAWTKSFEVFLNEERPTDRDVFEFAQFRVCIIEMSIVLGDVFAFIKAEAVEVIKGFAKGTFLYLLVERFQGFPEQGNSDFFSSKVICAFATMRE